MGYYTTLVDCNAYIAHEDMNEAWVRLCNLNNRNDLKNGGSHPRKWCACTGPRHDCKIPHEGVWFSWMPWNYPVLFSDAAEILSELGFYLHENNMGWYPTSYDDKTGNEEDFVRALEGLWRSFDDTPPHFEWRGEDGYMYKWIMLDGVMRTAESKCEWIIVD